MVLIAIKSKGHAMTPFFDTTIEYQEIYLDVGDGGEPPDRQMAGKKYALCIVACKKVST